MKKISTFDFVGLVGLAAGLMLSQGCRTTYSEQASAEDLSLRPMPESLAPEATGDIVPVEEPKAKELPYWKQVQQQGGADADPYADAIGSDSKDSTTVGGVAFTSYTIKKNDTISHIALRYGLRWQDIAAVNPGLNVNKIRVGQVIRLPGSVDLSKARTVKSSHSSSSSSSKKSSIYIVKKNDILGRIARAYGVKIADIKKANGLKNDFIREGQKLVIPAKGTVVKAPAATSSAKKAEKKSETATPAPAPVVPGNSDLMGITAPAVVPASTSVAPATPTAPIVAPPAAPAVAPAKPAAPAVKPAETFSYHVLEGEDLYEVGVHWGVSTSQLEKLNPGVIGEGGKLVPGTVLQIPAGAVAQ